METKNHRKFEYATTLENGSRLLFTHLHVHTEYSLLDESSRITALFVDDIVNLTENAE